jgi:hypothetical protein
MRGGKQDSRFLKHRQQISNELTVKWKQPNATEDNKKFDWYIWPFPNATTGRILWQNQSADVF